MRKVAAGCSSDKLVKVGILLKLVAAGKLVAAIKVMIRLAKSRWISFLTVRGDCFQ